MSGKFRSTEDINPDELDQFTNDECKNAYFAGLIDGEGTIGLYLARSKNNKLYEYVKVHMTDLPTIQAHLDYFKVGSIQKCKQYAEHHKPSWQWTASHYRGRFVTKLIYPYLITKRENARILLAYRD